MNLDYKFFFWSMVIVLVLIGMLQFLALPKYLDYMLLFIAIIFGTIGLIKKLK